MKLPTALVNNLLTPSLAHEDAIELYEDVCRKICWYLARKEHLEDYGGFITTDHFAQDLIVDELTTLDIELLEKFNEHIASLYIRGLKILEKEVFEKIVDSVLSYKLWVPYIEIEKVTNDNIETLIRASENAKTIRKVIKYHNPFTEVGLLEGIDSSNIEITIEEDDDEAPPRRRATAEPRAIRNRIDIWNQVLRKYEFSESVNRVLQDVENIDFPIKNTEEAVFICTHHLEPELLIKIYRAFSECPWKINFWISRPCLMKSLEKYQSHNGNEDTDPSNEQMAKFILLIIFNNGNFNMENLSDIFDDA